MYGIDQIMDILPHRYPFLLIDKITSVEPGEKAMGIKNVTANEPFFQGHFPGHPLMPGVLIVEALAQVGAVALMSLEENEDKLAVFAGLDGVRFKKQVVPGDQLEMEVVLESMRRGLGKGKAIARVKGQVVCKATIMFGLVDRPESMK